MKQENGNAINNNGATKNSNVTKDSNGTRPPTLNVLGTQLQACCTNPVTGFYRTGKCETGTDDAGAHVVCAEMTAEFLEFTKNQGNDLSTPAQGFPGLVAGDKWCLCAMRWREAFDRGIAPPIVLAATHEAALRYIDLEDLQKHAADK